MAKPVVARLSEKRDNFRDLISRCGMSEIGVAQERRYTESPIINYLVSALTHTWYTGSSYRHICLKLGALHA